MTNYQKIYEVASNNYGLITNSEAEKIGVSRKELCVLAKRERIKRLYRGVYKIVDYIPVDYDVYASSVLAVGNDAHLYGESVLAMHNLCPVQTKKIYIATTKRVRKQLPKSIKIINVKDNKNIINYFGIPSQSIKDALITCIGHIMPDRLLEAINEAKKQGLIFGADYNEALNRIGDKNE